jgi:NADH:ubiquinone oxidoreductase subunit 5 (subunit L)/multisubunit Na+/H+ antiporter MnhA subunit
MHAPERLLLTPPVLLATAGLVAGLAAGRLDHALRPYADTLPGEQEYHLALWHGLNPALGLSVVAEGVETLEQLEFVRGSGGHMVQGYYFARPMPLAACTDFLLHPPSLNDVLQRTPVV